MSTIYFRVEIHTKKGRDRKEVNKTQVKQVSSINDEGIRVNDHLENTLNGCRNLIQRCSSQLETPASPEDVLLVNLKLQELREAIHKAVCGEDRTYFDYLEHLKHTFFFAYRVPRKGPNTVLTELSTSQYPCSHSEYTT